MDAFVAVEKKYQHEELSEKKYKARANKIKQSLITLEAKQKLEPLSPSEKK